MTQPDVLPGLLQAKAPVQTGFTIEGNKGELFKAIAAAQAAFEPVRKTKENPFFKSKYADLADVLDATLPALTANGLCLIQPPERVSPDGWQVHTILGHSSGASIEVVALVPSQGDWQKFGSALTYCRRYVVSALLGVASEPDDDGNAADDKSEGAPRTAPGPRQNTRATPPPTAPKADQKTSGPVKVVQHHTEDLGAEGKAIAASLLAKGTVPAESGGPNGAASPSAATEPVGKVESAPPPAGEGTWVQPSPPAAEAKVEPKKSTPPPSGALITAEQQKEIKRLTTDGERLWPMQEPDGSFKTYKFTRATLDQFCVQLTKKTTVQISTADEAAVLIAGLNKLPESNAVQRKIWADLKERFKADKEAGDAFCVALIGKPASWVCSPEEAAKLSGALAT